MSINWNWTDKMGEVTDNRGYTANLYRGNCFMIAVNEFQKDGKDLYSLAWFFADETHMKNCLGLTKGYEEESYKDFNWESFKLNTKYKEVPKFISALCKANAEIKIELYKEETK